MNFTWVCLRVSLLFACVCHTSAEMDRASRIKRQNAGDQLIDAVFQVPIQTLTAVGTLVKTSRPVVMAVRQQIQQQLQQGFTPQRFSLGLGQQTQKQRPQSYRRRRQDGDSARASTAAFNRLPGLPGIRDT